MSKATHTPTQASLYALDRMSLSDLHHKIGKMVEDRPGVLITTDHTFDSNKRPLEGLALDTPVNLDCANRLQDFAAEARERMGEERWQELNREWGQ